MVIKHQNPGTKETAKRTYSMHIRKIIRHINNLNITDDHSGQLFVLWYA